MPPKKKKSTIHKDTLAPGKVRYAPFQTRLRDFCEENELPRHTKADLSSAWGLYSSSNNIVCDTTEWLENNYDPYLDAKNRVFLKTAAASSNNSSATPSEETIVAQSSKASSPISSLPSEQIPDDIVSTVVPTTTEIIATPSSANRERSIFKKIFDRIVGDPIRDRVATQIRQIEASRERRLDEMRREVASTATRRGDSPRPGLGNNGRTGAGGTRLISAFSTQAEKNMISTATTNQSVFTPSIAPPAPATMRPLQSHPVTMTSTMGVPNGGAQLNSVIGPVHQPAQRTINNISIATPVLSCANADEDVVMAPASEPTPSQQPQPATTFFGRIANRFNIGSGSSDASNDDVAPAGFFSRIVGFRAGRQEMGPNPHALLVDGSTTVCAPGLPPPTVQVPYRAVGTTSFQHPVQPGQPPVATNNIYRQYESLDRPHHYQLSPAGSDLSSLGGPSSTWVGDAPTDPLDSGSSGVFSIRQQQQELNKYEVIQQDRVIAEQLQQRAPVRVMSTSNSSMTIDPVVPAAPPAGSHGEANVSSPATTTTLPAKGHGEAGIVSNNSKRIDVPANASSLTMTTTPPAQGHGEASTVSNNSKRINAPTKSVTKGANNVTASNITSTGGNTSVPSTIGTHPNTKNNTSFSVVGRSGSNTIVGSSESPFLPKQSSQQHGKTSVGPTSSRWGPENLTDPALPPTGQTRIRNVAEVGRIGEKPTNNKMTNEADESSASSSNGDDIPFRNRGAATSKRMSRRQRAKQRQRFDADDIVRDEDEDWFDNGVVDNHIEQNCSKKEYYDRVKNKEFPELLEGGKYGPRQSNKNGKDSQSSFRKSSKSHNWVDSVMRGAYEATSHYGTDSSSDYSNPEYVFRQQQEIEYWKNVKGSAVSKGNNTLNKGSTTAIASPPSRWEPQQQQGQSAHLFSSASNPSANHPTNTVVLDCPPQQRQNTVMMNNFGTTPMSTNLPQSASYTQTNGHTGANNLSTSFPVQQPVTTGLGLGQMNVDPPTSLQKLNHDGMQTTHLNSPATLMGGTQQAYNFQPQHPVQPPGGPAVTLDPPTGRQTVGRAYTFAPGDGSFRYEPRPVNQHDTRVSLTNRANQLTLSRDQQLVQGARTAMEWFHIGDQLQPGGQCRGVLLTEWRPKKQKWKSNYHVEDVGGSFFDESGNFVTAPLRSYDTTGTSTTKGLSCPKGCDPLVPVCFPRDWTLSCRMVRRLLESTESNAQLKDCIQKITPALPVGGLTRMSELVASKQPVDPALFFNTVDALVEYLAEYSFNSSMVRKVFRYLNDVAPDAVSKAMDGFQTWDGRFAAACHHIQENFCISFRTTVWQIQQHRIPVEEYNDYRKNQYCWALLQIRLVTIQRQNGYFDEQPSSFGQPPCSDILGFFGAEFASALYKDICRLFPNVDLDFQTAIPQVTIDWVAQWLKHRHMNDVRANNWQFERELDSHLFRAGGELGGLGFTTDDGSRTALPLAGNDRHMAIPDPSIPAHRSADDPNGLAGPQPVGSNLPAAPGALQSNVGHSCGSTKHTLTGHVLYIYLLVLRMGSLKRKPNVGPCPHCRQQHPFFSEPNDRDPTWYVCPDWIGDLLSKLVPETYRMDRPCNANCSSNGVSAFLYVLFQRCFSFNTLCRRENRHDKYLELAVKDSGLERTVRQWEAEGGIAAAKQLIPGNVNPVEFLTLERAPIRESDGRDEWKGSKHKGKQTKGEHAKGAFGETGRSSDNKTSKGKSKDGQKKGKSKDNTPGDGKTNVKGKIPSDKSIVSTEYTSDNFMSLIDTQLRTLQHSPIDIDEDFWSPEIPLSIQEEQQYFNTDTASTWETSPEAWNQEIEEYDPNNPYSCPPVDEDTDDWWWNQPSCKHDCGGDHAHGGVAKTHGAFSAPFDVAARIRMYRAMSDDSFSDDIDDRSPTVKNPSDVSCEVFRARRGSSVESEISIDESYRYGRGKQPPPYDVPAHAHSARDIGKGPLLFRPNVTEDVEQTAAQPPVAPANSEPVAIAPQISSTPTMLGKIDYVSRLKVLQDPFSNKAPVYAFSNLIPPFVATVTVCGDIYGRQGPMVFTSARGHMKKMDAKQDAAEQALKGPRFSVDPRTTSAPSSTPTVIQSTPVSNVTESPGPLLDSPRSTVSPEKQLPSRCGAFDDTVMYELGKKHVDNVRRLQESNPSMLVSENVFVYPACDLQTADRYVQNSVENMNFEKLQSGGSFGQSEVKYLDVDMKREDECLLDRARSSTSVIVTEQDFIQADAEHHEELLAKAHDVELCDAAEAWRERIAWYDRHGHHIRRELGVVDTTMRNYQFFLIACALCFLVGAYLVDYMFLQCDHLGTAELRFISRQLYWTAIMTFMTICAVCRFTSTIGGGPRTAYRSTIAYRAQQTAYKGFQKGPGGLEIPHDDLGANLLIGMLTPDRTYQFALWLIDSGCGVSTHTYGNNLVNYYYLSSYDMTKQIQTCSDLFELTAFGAPSSPVEKSQLMYIVLRLIFAGWDENGIWHGCRQKIDPADPLGKATNVVVDASCCVPNPRYPVGTTRRLLTNLAIDSSCIDKMMVGNPVVETVVANKRLERHLQEGVMCLVTKWMYKHDAGVLGLATNCDLGVRWCQGGTLGDSWGSLILHYMSTLQGRQVCTLYVPRAPQRLQNIEFGNKDEEYRKNKTNYSLLRTLCQFFKGNRAAVEALVEFAQLDVSTLDTATKPPEDADFDADPVTPARLCHTGKPTNVDDVTKSTERLREAMGEFQAFATKQHDHRVMMGRHSMFRTCDEDTFLKDDDVERIFSEIGVLEADENGWEEELIDFEDKPPRGMDSTVDAPTISPLDEKKRNSFEEWYWKPVEELQEKFDSLKYLSGHRWWSFVYALAIVLIAQSIYVYNQPTVSIETAGTRQSHTVPSNPFEGLRSCLKTDRPRSGLEKRFRFRIGY